MHVIIYHAQDGWRWRAHSAAGRVDHEPVLDEAYELFADAGPVSYEIRDDNDHPIAGGVWNCL